MNKKEQINKLVDEALSSADNIKRAVPMPFLLTRVNAGLNRTYKSGWEKAILFIGRPSIAIPGLALLLFINIMAVVLNRPSPFSKGSEQSLQVPTDDFSYTVSTIYDIENTEP